MKVKKLNTLKKAVKSIKYILAVDIDIDVKERKETFTYSVAYTERDTIVFYQSQTIINKLENLSHKPSLEYIEQLEKHFRTKCIRDNKSIGFSYSSVSPITYKPTQSSLQSINTNKFFKGYVHNG